ncbi:DUF3794 domain-containing protein [Desulforamulus ruminis]|uniref:SipL SPOCS domain-containing protein n=1 Tax=Desulforamulus ruminis (strain ATCC 23193 / DSM 2154 / NCIMB 8452 / DL) TaxID=696281 RepID=F6DLY1_DESRL|nr:DUF3794 domain-containing protein [Desulforamulus ruminis]AEG58424.1 hypothetical protein Desru_0123 [Desulforamulus ruminis DSM 2154]
MPNGLNCQLVKLPVVIAEQMASITVENVICPEEQAKKIDHIDVVVRDLEADPHFTTETGCNSPKATIHFGEPQCGPRFIRSITIHGEIHKQIFYVNKHDDVRHMSEDFPFSKNIQLHPPLEVTDPGNTEIDFRNVDVSIDFDLPRPNRLQQVVTVSFLLKIVEQRQFFVEICDVSGATLGIQDESFEDWINNTPALWESQNVCPNPNGRTGQAAALGCCPTLSASLSRNVEGLTGGTTYEMTFWARNSEVPRDRPCGYTLEARISFRDTLGNILNTAQQMISSEQLSTSYRQLRLTGTAPAGTVSANIAFVFTSQPWNTCSALIDDVSFGITNA